MCTEAHVVFRQIVIVFMYGVRCRSEAGADGEVFVFAASGQRPRGRSLPALRPIMGHSYSAQWIDGSAKLGHRHDTSPALRASRALRTRPRSLRTNLKHNAAPTTHRSCSLKIKKFFISFSGKST